MDLRFPTDSGKGPDLKIATVLGMDAEARASLAQLEKIAKSRKTAVAGCYMPDGGVSAHLASLGIDENVEEADFFQYRAVVIPYSGISSRQRRAWEEVGYPLEDLTAPQVRRAQVTLGLLRMEGAQAIVIGRHTDPETRAIADGHAGTRVIEDTTDTARLEFAPCFGAVCQTTLSPRRAAWLVQQLRHRWRDSRVTFLDTISPAMAAREEALERLLVVCDRLVIVGEPGESSCGALAEAALRRGKQALVVPSPAALGSADFRPSEKIVLTAGAFATDEAIRAVAIAIAAG